MHICSKPDFGLTTLEAHLLMGILEEPSNGPFMHRRHAGSESNACYSNPLLTLQIKSNARRSRSRKRNLPSTKRQLSRALSAGRCSAEGPENRAVPSIARVVTWASLGGAVESILVKRAWSEPADAMKPAGVGRTKSLLRC